MTLTPPIQAPEYEKHIRSGLEQLLLVRSSIHDLLSNDDDYYVKGLLLDRINIAELDLRKALA